MNSDLAHAMQYDSSHFFPGLCRTALASGALLWWLGEGIYPKPNPAHEAVTGGKA